MEDSILGQLIIAAVPATISLVLAIFTARSYTNQTKAELQKEKDAAFNQKRWEVYSSFSDLIGNVITRGSNIKSEKSNESIGSDLFALTNDLWLVGSDGVIEAVAELFLYLRREEEQKTVAEMFTYLYKILIEMRRDLGNTQTKIAPSHMFAPIITDIEAHLPIKK